MSSYPAQHEQCSFLVVWGGLQGFLLSALASHTKREPHSSEELKPATFPAAGTLSRDQPAHKLGQKPWKKQGESLQMWFQRSSRAQMPISSKPQSWLAMGTSTQPPKDRHGLGLHLSQERHLWALMSKDGQSRALTGIFKLLQASYCDMSSPLHVLAHSALSCLNVVSTPSPEVQCRP